MRPNDILCNGPRAISPARTNYRSLSPRQYLLHTDSDRWLFLVLMTRCVTESRAISRQKKVEEENDARGHARG